MDETARRDSEEETSKERVRLIEVKGWPIGISDQHLRNIEIEAVLKSK